MLKAHKKGVLNIKIGIIGASGTLGSALTNTLPGAVVINRIVDDSLLKKNFDIIFVCAPGGMKWYANQNPEHDIAEVDRLISLLSTLRTNRFIVFSTIDTLSSDNEQENRYGAHRKKLEDYILSNRIGSIVRLGVLVGPFIKKNFIYDLKAKETAFTPNPKSSFQFSNLFEWEDLINLIIKNEFLIFNYFSSSLTFEYIVNNLIGLNLISNSTNKIVTYNHSNTNDDKSLALFNEKSNTTATCLKVIQKYIENY
tara:strand:- start:3418 stop:4179 length:762 start_codon:yes stop_codon:yes gene_type:complete